jgi:hypothetical protein
MGSGVAPQCSRNRCLARWSNWIPYRGREQVERTPRKTWSRAPSEVYVPYTRSPARSSRDLRGELAEFIRKHDYRITGKPARRPSSRPRRMRTPA